MGTKISQLPFIASPDISDIFPVVQSGVTYKESISQLSTLLFTDPVISQINDAHGNTVVSFVANTVTDVNYISFVANQTANNPLIMALGMDANIGLTLESTADAGIIFKTAAVSAYPLTIFSGTTMQHQTNFAFADTANTRTVTFPDASGTVLFTTGTQQLASGSALLLDKGTGTESSHAVTINKQSGVITTTSLTTAQYSTETITLTNSEISTSSVVIASVMGGTNTTQGISVSATAGSTSSTIVLTNLNSAALNGTVIIGFAVF
jgi:hypothetical protein